MSVSVIIPSKNRAKDLLICLETIFAQKTLPLEIIVVDQSSERYVLPAFPQLRHFYMPELTGLTAARNYGVDRATGDIALFLDDDATLEGDAVGAIERAYAAEPELVGGACRFVNYELPLSLSEIHHRVFERGFFNAQPIRRNGRKELRTVCGAGMVFRTAMVQRERFNEKLIGYCLGEDFEFAQRARKYGPLVEFDEAPLRHEGSPVNRLNRMTYYRWRWRNFGMFFRDSEASRSPLGWLCYRWWQLGEVIRWVRFGFGDPRGVLVDPSPRPAAPNVSRPVATS